MLGQREERQSVCIRQMTVDFFLYSFSFYSFRFRFIEPVCEQLLGRDKHSFISEVKSVANENKSKSGSAFFFNMMSSHLRRVGFCVCLVFFLVVLFTSLDKHIVRLMVMQTTWEKGEDGEDAEVAEVEGVAELSLKWGGAKGESQLALLVLVLLVLMG